MSEAVVPTDGRTARRERNRQAVIDAFIDLMMSGENEPSVDEIASKAGVSYRSVYRYFEDRSDMFAAAADRAMEWIRPLLAEAAGPYDLSDPLDHRIDSVVDARSEVYLQIADVTRTALMRAPNEPRIAQALREARTILRGQISERFAPELEKFSERERELRLTSIDVALQVATLDYVMHERGHTRDELERYLRAHIRAALTIPEVDT